MEDGKNGLRVEVWKEKNTLSVYRKYCTWLPHPCTA